MALKKMDMPELKDIRNSILNQLYLIISVLGFPVLIITLINTRQEGRFPYFSTAGYVFILILGVFRDKVPFLVKVWVLIGFSYFIGTSGMLNEGLLSDSLLYLIITSILSSMLISVRAGIIITLVNMLTVMILAVAYHKGLMEYHFDILAYFRAPGTWIAYLLTAAFFAAIGILIFGKLENYLVNYISELKKNSLILTRSNQRLEQEITERQATEQNLKQSENKFRNVFNNIEEGLLLLSQDHRIAEVNAGLLKLTGFSKESYLNTKLENHFADFGKISFLPSSGALVQTGFNTNELMLKSNPEGLLIPVEITFTPFLNNPEFSFIVRVKDIRERKENEKRVLNAIISSEERERTRIAQDLHDGIGPLLSASKMYLSSLEIAPRNSKTETIRNELLGLTNMAITSIREISGNLSSHLLQASGLRGALDIFSRQITSSGVLDIAIDLPEKLKFRDNSAINLYRVIVELINNSVKYAQASRIGIRFTADSNDLVVEYSDNGVGFNMQETLENNKGMGLFNIHSRIVSMGGTVQYLTSPGKGVNVRICLDKTATLC